MPSREAESSMRYSPMTRRGGARGRPQVQHGPAVEHGGPGIGRCESRRVARDGLRHPGRRDEAADDALAVIGLQPVDAAMLVGQPPPDRQQQAGDDVQCRCR